jgi:hypothetical protein
MNRIESPAQRAFAAARGKAQALPMSPDQEFPFWQKHRRAF